MSKILLCLHAILLAGLTFLCSPEKSAPATAPKTQHRFLLVGGGSMPVSVRKHFIKMAGGENAHILVIPSASSKPEAPGFLDPWTGVASAKILHAKTRQDAFKPEFYGQIRESTGVWISGGDQARLMRLYYGTPVVTELKKLLNRGGVVGGTSAGASIVGSVMPYDDVEMTGFGLVNTYIFDQHFNTRKWRVDRLHKLVKDHPEMIGIGIDESTAFVIDTDGSTSIIGDGSVYVAKVK